MSKRKVRRPKEEMKQELIDQLCLLQNSCRTYDSGLEAAGKHIALSIRVLVHQHGQSQALIEQLGLRNCRFFDSAGPLNPRNLLPEHKLVALRMRVGTAGTEAQYIPLGNPPGRTFCIRFQDWWNQPVIKDGRGQHFSRRELVLNVADTDGGAHVDPELDEAYMRLSRQNSLGWTFTSGDITRKLEGRPELAAVRQIAYELLRTIASTYPELAQFAKADEPSQLAPNR
jgi:hypothetical protein